MSVPESKRGHGKLEVLVKANELAVYTIRICKNPKTFDPAYQNAITDDIIRTAKDIYIYCWTANNIRVIDGNHRVDPAKARLRKDYQDAAIRECYNLLALMQIAKSVFHLSAKRIKYWGNLTLEAREYIRKWKEGDSKRYAKAEKI